MLFPTATAQTTGPPARCRWKPAFAAFSPPATCGRDQSSGWAPRSARGQWLGRSFMSFLQTAEPASRARREAQESAASPNNYPRQRTRLDSCHRDEWHLRQCRLHQNGGLDDVGARLLEHDQEAAWPLLRQLRPSYERAGCRRAGERQHPYSIARRETARRVLV